MIKSSRKEGKQNGKWKMDKETLAVLCDAKDKNRSNKDMNKNNDHTLVGFIMDESDRPYEPGENPFPYTKADEEYEDYIIKKFGLKRKGEDEKEDDDTI